MSSPQPAGVASFWSCFTRQFSDPFANIYGDVIGERYDFDSRVPNSRQIRQGDVLVMRDQHLVYGWGVVSAVTSRPGVKDARACERCGSTSKWIERKTLSPRFRCSRCEHESNVLVPIKVDVTEFSAYYGDNWIEFGAPVPVRDLRPVFAMKDQQNAIRRLDPTAARAYIDIHQGVPTDLVVEFDDPGEWVRQGGLRETRVRVRRFQDEFRGKLLDRFGEVCAVTGRQPREVLDAAHLYSYAARPVHEERGGLLLRKDVHRLFDSMLLLVDPDDARAHVAPALLDRYPSLEPLDGQKLQVPNERMPRTELLASHAEAARERWATLKKDLAGR